MSSKLDQLVSGLHAALGRIITKQIVALGEVTVECKAADYLAVCQILRYDGLRYAVVSHLLSVSLNHRVRVRVFAQDEDFPILPTLVDIWPVSNWYEREAFDLYGIMFENHPDLRRLLTDYGFVGHPFRKDFPMIGN